MKTDTRHIEPPAPEDIEALRDEIARRPKPEKQTLIHCLKTGDAPPPSLLPLFEAIKAAVLHVDVREEIFSALEGPETLLIDPQLKDTAESISQEEAEEFARKAAGLLRLISPAEKVPIVEAIRDREKRERLTMGQRFLWGWLQIGLVMTAKREPPSDIRQNIAQTLNVSLEELDALTEETLREKHIRIPIEEKERDTWNWLPGMEPQPTPNRYPAPSFIFNPQTILPKVELFRKLHSLDLENVKDGALAKIGIDRRPHSRYVYMLMLDKLAEQYPITAGDKEILLALGNLYGERKKQPDGIGLQGGSIITAGDIVRRFRGFNARDSIDQASLNAVTERMKQLQTLKVEFNFEQHFQYRKKEIGDGEEVELAIPDEMRIPDKDGTPIRFSYSGLMVNANTIEVEYSSGRVETAWELLTPPIVFDYAQKIRQVETVETRLLDLRKKAKASGNNTSGADIMKIYLLERITAMIDPKTHQPRTDFSHTIALDTMFSELGIEIANRKTKKMKIDTARAILEHFAGTPDKHRGTFIKGHRVKKGYRGAVAGFEILF